MWKSIVLVICVILIVSVLYNGILYRNDLKKKVKIDNGYVDRMYNKFKHRFETSSQGRLPNTVDQIYCIRSEKRKDYVTKVMDDFGLKVKYLDAIFPKDLSEEDYDTLGTDAVYFGNKKSNYVYKTRKKSNIPVNVSFALCFMDAMKHKYKTIMVFEDDVQIDTGFFSFNQFLEEFDHSPFDILYMGYCLMSCNQNIDNINEYSNIMELKNKKRILCNHAIVLKTESFINYFNNMFPLKAPNDDSINDYCIENNKRIAITKKAYINQNKKDHKSMNGTPDTDRIAQTCDFT